jgi:cyclopropane fatty-acyl-phospholipid synthase-like methyltransferase
MKLLRDDEAGRPDDLLLEHYDHCLREHGDSAQGANWPNEEERRRRYDVMLDVIRGQTPAVLCDFACGTGELLAHARKRALDVHYIGADRSVEALRFARQKFPGAAFIHIDVLTASDEELNRLVSDYIVINGLFTVRAGIGYDDMWRFLTEVVTRLWPRARRGIAFNVMSSHVDWERDDLFHVPFDRLAGFLHTLAGRNIVFRADYGLYEYTAYAFRPASVGAR